MLKIIAITFLGIIAGLAVAFATLIVQSVYLAVTMGSAFTFVTTVSLGLLFCND